jgi:hypothetical protein
MTGGRREFQPAVRQAALLRAYYRCEQCGARERLQFHHRCRMDRSLFGCAVLCVTCHAELHQRQREAAKSRQRLRVPR